jgi:hypothetical protein
MMYINIISKYIIERSDEVGELYIKKSIINSIKHHYRMLNEDPNLCGAAWCHRPLQPLRRSCSAADLQMAPGSSRDLLVLEILWKNPLENCWMVNNIVFIMVFIMVFIVFIMVFIVFITKL